MTARCHSWHPTLRLTAAQVSRHKRPCLRHMRNGSSKQQSQTTIFKAVKA
jgi:hypothetical protein